MADVLESHESITAAIPSPPDLSRCTRLELEYYPSTLEYFFVNEEPNVLSLTELECVQSLKVVIEDPNRIEAIADEIALGHYVPGDRGPLTFSHVIQFSCYHGDDCVGSFLDFNRSIFSCNKDWFDYDTYLENTRFVPEEIAPLVRRAHCGTNLGHLFGRIQMYYWDRNEFPRCTSWCDDLLATEVLQEQSRYLRAFICPGADAGKCHYAMNPYWTPDSPQGMVVLFETESGWNQCGGMELFTFNNHEPRGGCVLLNDVSLESMGTPTVKFIRTKEELAQLRWKP